MPGVPGAGGPVPKHQRRRRNEPTGPEPVEAAALPVDVPDPDPDWHPVARRWFESLGQSGQRVFYQAADWAMAAVIAESISREMSPQPMVVGKGEHARIEMVELPPKSSSVAAWLKASTALLATAGDRRRAAVDLSTGASVNDDSEVPNIDDFRDRLSG